ncbi:hypothetical protein BTU51_1125 [Rickettsia rickettsii]|uniref:Uncharacterized protein n=1 Tax=Rickettsia rickettsii (strain Iowa) TaxID=452659 RepID=B0BUK1_RICRO|nr:hypothetical protein RrIowa_1125 [Rickettsia rickettsii str. Iowa]APU55861.1 hypothetical protein BTU50_1125 [Rickettsia rickettsii]APU57238.1 hypothetical protein BTU51_1125 [Rickettsia rickettsii]
MQQHPAFAEMTIRHLKLEIFSISFFLCYKELL